MLRWAADGFSEGESLTRLWLVLLLFTIPSLALTLYALDKWCEQIEWTLLVHLGKGPLFPVGASVARNKARLRIRRPHPSASSHLIFVFAGSFLMLLITGILSEAGVPGGLLLLVSLAGLLAIFFTSYRRARRQLEDGRFDLILDRDKQDLQLVSADGVPFSLKIRDIRELVVGPVAVDEGEGSIGTHFAVRLRRRAAADVPIHVWEDIEDAELFAQALSDYSGIPVGRLS